MRSAIDIGHVWKYHDRADYPNEKTATNEADFRLGLAE